MQSFFVRPTALLLLVATPGSGCGRARDTQNDSGQTCDSPSHACPPSAPTDLVPTALPSKARDFTADLFEGDKFITLGVGNTTKSGPMLNEAAFSPFDVQGQAPLLSVATCE